MKLLHKLIAWLTGKNLKSAPKGLILDQLNEQRPLPLGMTEFDEWSDRLIAGAMLTADKMSQKFALAEMIPHLPPQDDHCSDAYFIKRLRRVAANQIALEKMRQIRDEAKARLAEQEAKEKENVKELKTSKVVDLSRGKDGA